MFRDIISQVLPVFIIICSCYLPVAIHRDLKKMSINNLTDKKSD